MSAPATLARTWKEIEAVADFKWSNSSKQMFLKDYGEAMLRDVQGHIGRYLEAFPREKGANTVIRDLARLLNSGDWPPPPPRPEPVAALVAEQNKVKPVGLCSDPLLAEFPPLVQAMVEDRLEGTNICVDYAIAGALAQLAALAGNRLRYRAWGDERIPNLFVVLVGLAGSSHKSSVARWVKQRVGEADARALAPDEGSVEALIRSLGEYPSQLWIRDEFAGLLASMKAQDYMRPVRELLMSLYDHMGIYRRYLMRATYTCTNPALSFFGTIQPTVLGEELFSGRNVDSGFVSRLIFVCGAGVERWPAVELDRGRLGSELKMLANKSVIHLNARSAADIVEVEQPVALAEQYGSWLAERFPTHALKIAALLAWVRGEEKALDDRDVYPAMALVRRWQKTAAVLIGEVHMKTPGERQRREVYAFICKRSHNGTGPPAKGEIAEWAHVGKRVASELSDDLEERGWVSEADDGKLQCTKRSYLCLQRAK